LAKKKIDRLAGFRNGAIDAGTARNYLNLDSWAKIPLAGGAPAKVARGGAGPQPHELQWHHGGIDARPNLRRVKELMRNIAFRGAQ